MSAHAYIRIEDVPLELRETSAHRIDDMTGATLISFDGCALVGQSEADNAQQVVFPFPRHAWLRWQLVDWLMHHGISFTVVM